MKTVIQEIIEQLHNTPDIMFSSASIIQFLSGKLEDEKQQIIKAATHGNIDTAWQSFGEDYYNKQYNDL